MTGRSWRGVALAGMLLAAGADAAAIIGVVVTAMPFAAVRDSFLAPNAFLSLGCAACGLLIAWHRPRHPVGWLLLAAGVCQSATAGVTPWLAQALANGSAPRLLGTIYGFCWPWAVALFIPLALLLFPDGRLPGRAWRIAVVAAIANAPLQVLQFSSGTGWSGLQDQVGVAAERRAQPWIALPDAMPDAIGHGSDAVLGLVLVAAVAGLVVRYARGAERERRQLLWLTLGAAIATVLLVASRASLDGQLGVPVFALVGVTLIPVSIAVAVLRYQLLDIRLVWSRSLSYALLTTGVVVGYLLLVQATDVLLDERSTSVLVTLIVAAAFTPVRVWLQKSVDRLLYGHRADPVRAASAVTAELSSPEDLLPVLCETLRLPYSALRDGTAVLAEHGSRPEQCERFALSYGGAVTGYLEVGMRPGERRLHARDRTVLELVAAPVGVALRATALSRDVVRSRRDIVTAREEERRRLSRDLHDGLGPLLTGVGFQADAVGNIAHADPDRAAALAKAIRASTDAALDDVRRLLYELRPLALDGLGLMEAISRHASQLHGRIDGRPLAIVVRASTPLPVLPAAVEVVAYRILTEALTNVVRHSTATAVDVLLGAEASELLLTVQDNGSGDGRPWRAGLGLTSMRERVSELDGDVAAGPTSHGGRVRVRIPLEATV